MGDIRTPSSIFLEALATVVLGEQEDATLSPVVFARYVSLLDRLHAIAPSFAEFETLVPAKFSSGEIAVRPFESNPEKGLQALKDLRTRRTTLEKLWAELSTQAVPRNRGRSLRDRAATVARAEKLLASEAGRRIGSSTPAPVSDAARHYGIWCAKDSISCRATGGDRGRGSLPA